MGLPLVREEGHEWEEEGGGVEEGGWELGCGWTETTSNVHVNYDLFGAPSVILQVFFISFVL